ncbi:fluoride efflux transporter CrcB [Paucisalibacillus globulus]|uniref:fluoride efflux transporter CrcB n=1 Tax=Paucisalibacillus globulus TaxID=351095 RepID=UPI000BB77F8A|nr:fluoride efflux transporter CrcB [Paucisalibacillus globulus]
MNFIIVALGGLVGSILRFYISIKLNKRLIATWIANISGSIILAFLLYYYSNDVLNKSLWLFFGVGFCGSYSTFSTFGNESLQLIMNNQLKAAMKYMMTTLLVSLLCVGIILSLLGYQF